jgi:hypothetical protein
MQLDMYPSACRQYQGWCLYSLHIRAPAALTLLAVFIGTDAFHLSNEVLSDLRLAEQQEQGEIRALAALHVEHALAPRTIGIFVLKNQVVRIRYGRPGGSGGAGLTCPNHQGTEVRHGQGHVDHPWRRGRGGERRGGAVVRLLYTADTRGHGRFVAVMVIPAHFGPEPAGVLAPFNALDMPANYI